MMFSGLDGKNGYIERAAQIWLVQVAEKGPPSDQDGCNYYRVNVIEAFKGNPESDRPLVCSVFRPLALDGRYLFFGFNRLSTGIWMDNGNISPVPVPRAMSTNELKGKSLREKLSYIINGRRKEIDTEVLRLKEENNDLGSGMDIDRRNEALRK
jgi:hypothetical protein